MKFGVVILNSKKFNELKINVNDIAKIHISDEILSQSNHGVYIYYRFNQELGFREFYIGKAAKQSLKKRAEQKHSNRDHESFSQNDFEKTISIVINRSHYNLIPLLEVVLIKSIKKDIKNIKVFNVKDYISNKTLEIDSNSNLYQEIIERLTLLGYDLFKKSKIDLEEKEHVFRNGLKATVIVNDNVNKIVILKKGSFIKMIDSSFNFNSFYNHGSHIQLLNAIKQLKYKKILRESDEDSHYYEVTQNIDFPNLNEVSAFVSARPTNANTYWK